jgi:hypothetical protein
VKKTLFSIILILLFTFCGIECNPEKNNQNMSNSLISTYENAASQLNGNLDDFSDESSFDEYNFLFDKDRFGTQFPNLNYFDITDDRLQNSLKIYFLSRNDYFKKYIELSCFGKTIEIKLDINAEGYSGVVVKNTLYLSWILGPKKGHLLPETGQIYLFAIDLSSMKIIYKDKIYSGNNDLIDTSLSYLPLRKSLVLAFEKLNSSDFLFYGKIPISKVVSKEAINFEPKKINTSGFISEHSLPKFFKSNKKLFYFTRGQNSFLITEINKNGNVFKKYLVAFTNETPEIISFDDFGYLYFFYLGNPKNDFVVCTPHQGRKIIYFKDNLNINNCLIHSYTYAKRISIERLYHMKEEPTNY